MISARYRLLRTLGSGGMGRVWEAHDGRLDTRVALKELWLPPAMAPEERAERLKRAELEALNAARLRDHPNIVTVHDVLVEDGCPWIVMQLVSGGTLQDRLTDGPVSVSAARRLAKALLGALDAAHRHNIVHRDVKPANVMVTEERQILLTDFGIAASEAGTGLTATGVVVGSAPYLAPERAKGEKYGPASDLFSLGVTLFEALEGASPFHRESSAASLHAVAYEEAPRMRRAGPLEPLVTALLAKAPADRPSVAEAAAMLKGKDWPNKPSEGTTGGGRQGTAELPTKTTAEKTTAKQTPTKKATTKKLPPQKKPAAPAAQKVKLEIANEAGAQLRVRADEVTVGWAAARTTATFKVKAAARAIEVTSSGLNRGLWQLKAKPGETVRLAARKRGKDLLLSSAGTSAPASRAPSSAGSSSAGASSAGSSSARPSSAGSPAGSGAKPSGGTSNSTDNSGTGCVLLVLAAIGLALLLYGQHQGFSRWVSHELHDDASTSKVGDCLFYDTHQDADKQAGPVGEWVRVPCWSAAAEYEVSSLYAPLSATGTRTCTAGGTPVVLTGRTLCATRK
ncbi:serine/threonine-protein kinase [Streptomyces sp. CA-250714]|uniref:serine/threonine-protein kinase n=1 Tax=Streptomyces sp. CA-250714 TaxID=3240060 RepID=UPI003D915C49